MSWWSNQPLSSQRHHCLEAARTYQRAKARFTVAWDAHQEALGKLKATGAVLVYVRKPYDAEAEIRLPTQAALADAGGDVRRAWAAFTEALEECPAVQAEVFAGLGAR